MASLVKHLALSLAELVELVRGQTREDYRPNKALWPADFQLLFKGYHHLEVMVDIAQNGFRIPRKDVLPRQSSPPQNHGSAKAYELTLIRLMRQGQAAHQYVFLDEAVTTLWSPALFNSPLGLVPKGKEPMSVVGLCGSGTFKKCHFIPDTLGKPLSQFASKRWGGVQK